APSCARRLCQCREPLLEAQLTHALDRDLDDLVAALLARANLCHEPVHARALPLAELGLDRLERRDLDVGVAPLAESVRQLLNLAQQRLVLTLREARGEDLERRSQTAGGHAHVVHALRVARVEYAVGEREDLLAAHLDRHARRLGERDLALEAGHLARTGHQALAARSGLRRSRITPSRTPPFPTDRGRPSVFDSSSKI